MEARIFVAELARGLMLCPIAVRTGARRGIYALSNVGGIGSVFASLVGLTAGSTTHVTAPKSPASTAEPASTAAGHSSIDLLSQVQSRFSTSMSSVLTDAANGAYDDPDIAARSAVLRKTLAGITAARQAASGADTIGQPVPTDGTGGAHAAPIEIAPGTDTGTGTAVGGAQAVPTDVVATQHQLMELDVQQAQARQSKVHASLTQRFSSGAQLPSALTGQLDYHTFRPRTRADADAFAQRMAIDVTDGAAALEVTATKLQLAKADAALKPADAAASAAVAALVTQYDSQQARVLDMVQVVDAQTGGSISKDTPPSAPDRVMAAVSAAAVASNADPSTIATTIDKLSRMDNIVGQEATVPGGSTHLNRAVEAFAASFSQYIADEADRAAERQRDEQKQHDANLDDDRRAEEKSQGSQQVEAHAQQWAAEAVAQFEAAAQLSAQSAAQFDARLNKTQARAS